MSRPDNTEYHKHGCFPVRRSPHEVVIRAYPQTERVLQKIITSFRMTFWGEAVDLVFRFYMENTDLMPETPPLSTLPVGLFEHIVRNKYLARSTPVAAPIMCDLSLEGFRLPRNMAHRIGCSPSRAASAFIHCHAETARKLLDGAGRGTQ